ncbi:hypothetical protein XAC3607_1340083 [Xanthomonas citri pv. citri]|nr:hypothetical protein XAC3612_1000076 [Xanthomonas citri pv. citri]CEH73739.1 hypothetical protein XAC3607_1340083 [Xanthomonas citri pv. citri]
MPGLNAQRPGNAGALWVTAVNQNSCQLPSASAAWDVAGREALAAARATGLAALFTATGREVIGRTRALCGACAAESSSLNTDTASAR